MCFAPAAPSTAKPPPPPPEPTSKDVTAAREKNQAQAALAEGRSSTILTSGLGLTTPATTAPKKIFGI